MNQSAYQWNPKVIESKDKVVKSIDGALTSVSNSKVVVKAKHTLEESAVVQKISSTGKSVFGFLADKTIEAATKVDQKIESNPKLSKAKTDTKE
jgi:hypothetical protein